MSKTDILLYFLVIFQKHAHTHMGENLKYDKQKIWLNGHTPVAIGPMFEAVVCPTPLVRWRVQGTCPEYFFN